MKALNAALLLVVLFLTSIEGNAQTSQEIDSLWQKSRFSKNDSIRLKAANHLAFHYVFRDPITADSILKHSQLYAAKHKLHFNLTEIVNTRGIYFDVLGEKDSSKAYFEKALELSRKYNFPNIEVMCINNLGMFCWNNGQFIEALGFFHEALNFEYKGQNKNSSQKAIYLNNIGLIHQELNQFEKAITYHEQALEIRKKHNQIKGLAESYNNLAICFKELKQLNSAKEYITLAIAFAKKANQAKLYFDFFGNLGNILNLQKDYEGAEEAYLTALEMPEDYQNAFRHCFTIGSNLIDLYVTTKQFDKAKKAILDNEKLLEQDTSLHYFAESFYLNSAKTHYALQEVEKATSFFESYVQLKDSLFSKENATALAEMEAILKTKQKEAELATARGELLEKELGARRQNLIIYGSLVLIVLLLFMSYFIIQSKQLKNKKLRKEAELETALAKIELKNRLEEQRLQISRDLHDNIGSQLTFVISGLQLLHYQKEINSESVKCKLAQLSNFTQQTIHELRDTIWAMNKEVVELADLINRLNNFISQLEIKENVFVKVSDEVASQTEDLNFNALGGIQIYRIIQESINNAIKHAEAQEIAIYIQLQNNQLKITVEDDGKGFDTTIKEQGNGLLNIEKRAEKLGAKIVIASTIGAGTVVELLLPQTSEID